MGGENRGNEAMEGDRQEGRKRGGQAEGREEARKVIRQAEGGARRMGRWRVGSSATGRRSMRQTRMVRGSEGGR